MNGRERGGEEPKKEFRKKNSTASIVWQFYTRDNSFRMKRSSAFVIGFTSISKALHSKLQYANTEGDQMIMILF